MTNEEEIDIINKREMGIPLSDIMKEYSIKSAKTIYDIIKRNGVKRVGNKKYTVDDKYFEVIDSEEKSYWLGFLYADGYVRLKYNRSGELKLKLSIKDKDHLLLFTKCLSSNYKIREFKSYVVKNGVISQSDVVDTSIYNTKIVKDLIRHGCVSKKTFTIRLPELDTKIIRHFIRGYFDGDGNIYKIKNRPNSFSISIASNIDFIKDLKNIIGYGELKKHGNIYLLIISRIEEVKKFYHYIYDGSTFYLKRKKEIFQKIKF